jgi:lysyl endopeptidase
MSRVAKFAAAVLAGCTTLATLAQQMPSRASPSVEQGRFVMRAPQGGSVALTAAAEAKSADGLPDRGGRRVGTVRAVANTVAPADWTAVEGGWAARFTLTSDGATGLRARISLPEGIVDAQVVARGTRGELQGFFANGTTAWTPWTEGSSQEVEVFSAARPAQAPVVEAIVHFDSSPLAKASAGACSPDVVCTSGDAARDAAIAERRNSVALVSFVEGTDARVCTGTLINTEKFPTPYLVTANHCVATAAAAASVTTLWFDEATTCGGTTVSPALRQVAGGATLVLTSYGPDSTLLQLKSNAPAGAVFSGWNAARLADGDEVVSISHPQGDVKKFALGAEKAELLVRNYPQQMYGVSFTRGVTEGGSSGSGLFTMAGGSLQLRGVLSGSTLRTGAELSCANADQEEALYGRFEIFQPQIAGYIAATPPVRPDDYGNRITEAQRIFPVALAIPSEVAYPGRLDYAGDMDVFRVDIPTAGGTLTLRTEGGVDTIATLLDASGKSLKSVNDAESDKPDFGLTRTLAAGTYHLAVAHHEAQGTGAYTLKASLSTVTDNYTDLWWNPSESGWGLNINHQGQTLFVTLFTFDQQGRPLWLVAPSVTRTPSGYWEGTLYRTTGPAFNAVPWTAVTLETAGMLRLTFKSTSKADLSYSFDSIPVQKSIERQVFSVPPVCHWSAFDRSLTTNFQDLWWNPAEPGWGINLTHQGDILFATLFTYDESGKGLWLVMSRGERIADGLYIGELLAVAGPPFNASPWRPVTVTRAGTLTVQFTRGNAATITYTLNGQLVVKNIQRQVFGVPATECFAPGDD